jgi:hypothetical protein
LARAVAQKMVSRGHWENVYWVDLGGCGSGMQCALTLTASCGVPADGADGSMMVAWLARCPGMSMGLVVRCPSDVPEAGPQQLAYLVRRFLKVCEEGETRRRGQGRDRARAE